MSKSSRYINLRRFGGSRSRVRELQEGHPQASPGQEGQPQASQVLKGHLAALPYKG